MNWLAVGVFDEKTGLTSHEVVDDSIKLNQSTTIKCVVEQEISFSRIHGCGSFLVVVV